MSAATDQEHGEQLEMALTTSREIGIAVGILMNQSRLDRTAAFRCLSQASQRMNIKLHDLAAGIVAGHEQNVRAAAQVTTPGV